MDGPVVLLRRQRMTLGRDANDEEHVATLRIDHTISVGARFAMR
jgi:hypothetical protein